MPDGRSQQRVKICGVMWPEDARLAAAAGADYVGAILSPGFPRSVDAEVASGFLTSGAALVGVFVDAPVDEVTRSAESAGATILQLHGDEPTEDVVQLKGRGPWEIWKAVPVLSERDIEAALARWVGVADGLLLDGPRAGNAGGGGTRFPWRALEAVRQSVPTSIELIVAGGLTPETVAHAVERLTPDVVDVSSGVETQLGLKDPARVRAFIARARGVMGPERVRAESE